MLNSRLYFKLIGSHLVWPRLAPLLIVRNLTLFSILFSACSQIPFIKNSQDSDPVARVALPFRITSPDRRPSAPTQRANLDQAIREGIFQGNLVPGMSRAEAIQVWGKPHSILYAGDPEVHNEKWIYSDRPDLQGTDVPVKVVYFEEGQVVGWESH